MQKRFFPSARPVRRKSRVQRSGLLSLRRVRRLTFLRRRPERDTKASFVMTRLPGPPFRYWVPVSPPEGLDRRRRRYWPLVLDALGLPRWISGTGQKTVLWVPCLTEKRSRAELADFEAEPERAMRRLPVLPEHPCSALSALLLVPVILLHLIKNGWRTLPGAFTALFPQTPSGWVDLFGMDTVRTRIFHEWHRAGTALFLHADAQHLTGNCVFAALFLWFLSRAAGPGWAMLVTVLGGMLGYCAEALLRTAPAVSIGFSTALFAAVGALSGLMSLRSRALAVPPLAAGAALLAMLGTEGENTDYMAHICGLACGTGLGLLLGLILRRFPSSAGPAWQAAAGTATFLLPLLCFISALR